LQHQAWDRKCYRCGEFEHKSNEFPKIRQVNTADYKDKDEVQMETELEDSDFTQNMEILILSFRNYSATRRSSTPHNDIKFSTQGI